LTELVDKLKAREIDRQMAADHAEEEFRKCKQEPAFAAWAMKHGLELCKLLRG
jgi:hypothetical protein